MVFMRSGSASVTNVTFLYALSFNTHCIVALLLHAIRMKTRSSSQVFQISNQTVFILSRMKKIA